MRKRKKRRPWNGEKSKENTSNFLIYIFLTYMYIQCCCAAVYIIKNVMLYNTWVIKISLALFCTCAPFSHTPAVPCECTPLSEGDYPISASVLALPCTQTDYDPFVHFSGFNSQFSSHPMCYKVCNALKRKPAKYE